MKKDSKTIAKRELENAELLFKYLNESQAENCFTKLF